MKIYTKTGDKGETSLFGGDRVKKSDLRIKAYGTVDELNSYIGLVRDLSESESLRTDLNQIQNNLFALGAMLATPESKSKLKSGKDRLQIKTIHEEEVHFLERRIDMMNEELEPMRFFVLPGGHQTVSFCHIARCVCRRAERNCVELEENEAIDAYIVRYLNRLSDYLFVVARKLTLDLGVEEIPWKPRE